MLFSIASALPFCIDLPQAINMIGTLSRRQATDEGQLMEIGLALSGGGVRTAVFHLGVLRPPNASTLPQGNGWPVEWGLRGYLKIRSAAYSSAGGSEASANGRQEISSLSSSAIVIVMRQALLLAY